MPVNQKPIIATTLKNVPLANDVYRETSMHMKPSRLRTWDWLRVIIDFKLKQSFQHKPNLRLTSCHLNKLQIFQNLIPTIYLTTRFGLKPEKTFYLLTTQTHFMIPGIERKYVGSYRMDKLTFVSVVVRVAVVVFMITLIIRRGKNQKKEN